MLSITFNKTNAWLIKNLSHISFYHRDQSEPLTDLKTRDCCDSSGHVVTSNNSNTNNTVDGDGGGGGGVGSL